METEDSTKYLLQKQNIGSSRGGGTNSEKISVQLFLHNFGTLIPKILVIFYKSGF